MLPFEFPFRCLARTRYRCPIYLWLVVECAGLNRSLDYLPSVDLDFKVLVPASKNPPLDTLTLDLETDKLLSGAHHFSWYSTDLEELSDGNDADNSPTNVMDFRYCNDICNALFVTTPVMTHHHFRGPRFWQFKVKSLNKVIGTAQRPDITGAILSIGISSASLFGRRFANRGLYYGQDLHNIVRTLSTGFGPPIKENDTVSLLVFAGDGDVLVFFQINETPLGLGAILPYFDFGPVFPSVSLRSFDGHPVKALIEFTERPASGSLPLLRSWAPPRHVGHAIWVLDPYTLVCNSPNEIVFPILHERRDNMFLPRLRFLHVTQRSLAGWLSLLSRTFYIQITVEQRSESEHNSKGGQTSNLSKLSPRGTSLGGMNVSLKSTLAGAVNWNNRINRIPLKQTFQEDSFQNTTASPLMRDPLTTKLETCLLDLMESIEQIIMYEDVRLVQTLLATWGNNSAARWIADLEFSGPVLDKSIAL